jgi:hypothetical protein
MHVNFTPQAGFRHTFPCTLGMQLPTGQASVNAATQLEQQDLRGLESVAEGRALSVPAAVVSRLLAMGLVQKLEEEEHGAMLQLTPKGLSFIRSSDQ